MFIRHDLPPPLFEGNHDSFGKQPSLLDQLDDGQANKLQCVHKRRRQFSLNSLPIAATGRTSEPAKLLPSMKSVLRRRPATCYALALRGSEDTRHPPALDSGSAPRWKQRAQSPLPPPRAAGNLDLNLLGFCSGYGACSRCPRSVRLCLTRAAIAVRPRTNSSGQSPVSALARAKSRRPFVRSPHAKGLLFAALLD